MATSPVDGEREDVYTPTSAVSDTNDLGGCDGEQLHTTDGAEYRNDDQTEEAHYHKFHESETGGGGGGHEIGERPELMVGSRYNKVCPLRPNRWVGVGRSKKSQLLLDNSGVSRNHCDIRWDPHRRIVELRDTSVGGTMVNGQTIKKSRCILAHADHITIEGKGIYYNFLLDMRPVKLGFSDPRADLMVQQSVKKAIRAGPSQQRDILRSQIVHMDATIKACMEQAFEKEKLFYSVATQRRLRLVEDKDKDDRYHKYLRGAEQLQQQLQLGREEWLERLQQEYEKNETDVNEIIEETKTLQEKVEKLQLKKDELERSIHPEKYAVADISVTGSGDPHRSLTSDQQQDSGAGSAKAIGGGDSSFEEEHAFSGDDKGLDSLEKEFEQAVADEMGKQGDAEARPEEPEKQAAVADETDEAAAKRRKIADD
mmetsp:Transcript_78731/g.222684  ORF Transcript_78731/g.222684 Transcript_78731/m.222684 type:complete len:427 (+) Transcript_78731:81-1361(+)